MRNQTKSRPRVQRVIMRSQYFLKNWRIVCWLNPTLSQEDIMLKKGVLSLALVIGMPVYAAEHWIDVRVPEQYQQQHIQGAVNIPLKEIKARIVTEVPDKNDTVKLYCNSGRQSGQAKDMLTEMGYTQVTNEGGINQIALPKVENK